MKKKLRELTGKIGDSLKIPKDLSYQEAMLTMTGTKELYLENYQCIWQYQDTCILVLSHQNEIKIEGTNLEIQYYSNVEMKIAGDVSCISFSKEG